MENKIKINNINFSYRGNDKQLTDINLTILSGQCLAIVGKSGCGKSTLTRVINGLIPSFYQGYLDGDVFIDDKNLGELNTWEIGSFVGNVFQDPRSQFFANEVAGEIAFGCENLGLSHNEIVDRVHKSAKEMNILELLNTSIYTLSYGMRQRVAICSAKAMQPDIYVLDEPSANLDLKSTYQFAKLIQKLKKEGKTIIIVEHRLFYLNSIVDNYIFMVDGKIKKNYTSDEFNNISSKELNDIGLRSLHFEDIFLDGFTNQSTQGYKSFEISGISKKYGKNLLLNNISFKFDSNEIIALIGSNGVGKSTLGKICSGLQKETSGEIFLEDKPIKRKSRLDKIWYIPQDLDSQLFGEDLVDELVTGLKDKEKYIEKAEVILKRLGLFELKNQHPSTLSGGQKQRLVLGVAMMRNISVVILDEPTSGLDYGSMEQVANLIREQRDLGTKFLIISHDIEFIVKISERVIKMEDGRITEDYYLKDINTLLNSMGYER
ncbi:TPA: energy-coupling factor ABC transporter ATP-binding protein [Clostridioides difficile]|uniref:ABC-type transport system, cobalt-specific ATP-binding protein Tn1549-like, CTn2-Orf26 n=5 Tax=Peptostreptococcaceae TaxID=186804 RepID=Q188L7_CLOD6|nr:MULTISPECIES: energy-coupling factor ABC transporter ATP-binding protein [Peptostreptococcaceae]AJP10126.1 ABC-type transport system, ATP-binding protein [Clostridioides difficile 630]ARE61334.1 ABC-type transport system, ATP-binding protein [Clostridioides difficile]MBC2575542.1 energy-coupling factor ABC transporter ATP-binding protein [Peptostreptococcus canis]MBP1997265.1 energy-coupling factor transport system ATP-binding protein [Peptostreptococcus canis]MBY2199738.1 energy-coupling f